MKAPEQEGRYTAFFRLQTAFRSRFGHKINCDIMCTRPGSEQLAPVQDSVEAVVDRKPSAAAKKPRPYVEPKTPMDLYFAKVELETDESLKEDLGTLYQLGFVDFYLNLKLTRRYKDIKLVINTLLSWSAHKNEFCLNNF